jgi:hypothetical protein
MSLTAPYYVHKNCLFSVHFPEKWAVEYLDGTGPHECHMCKEHGCWNGVFIAYCYQCAQHCYKGERGRGMLTCGLECSNDEVSTLPSIFDTYLLGVDLDSIGDIQIEDTRKLLAGYAEILDFQNEFMDSRIELSEYPENSLFNQMSDIRYGSYMNGGYDSY